MALANAVQPSRRACNVPFVGMGLAGIRLAQAGNQYCNLCLVSQWLGADSRYCEHQLVAQDWPMAVMREGALGA